MIVKLRMKRIYSRSKTNRETDCKKRNFAIVSSSEHLPPLPWSPVSSALALYDRKRQTEDRQRQRQTDTHTGKETSRDTQSERQIDRQTVVLTRCMMQQYHSTTRLIIGAT